MMSGFGVLAVSLVVTVTLVMNVTLFLIFGMVCLVDVRRELGTLWSPRRLVFDTIESNFGVFFGGWLGLMMSRT